MKVNSSDFNNQIFYSHVRSDIFNIDFHLHEGYEVYFLIAGDVNYFVEKKNYPLKYGDLIITNPNEIHKPAFLSARPYERIFVQFTSRVPDMFRSEDYDLLSCFNDRPSGEKNKVTLTKLQLEDINKIFGKIEGAAKSLHPGSGVLKAAYFMELLVFVNRVFRDSRYIDEHEYLPPKLAPILEYIDSNTESDLTLNALESRFYINRYYLSRLFKKSTGMNIHEYVLYKRLLLAKRLLAEGRSVAEACQQSGFSDYSNFIRTFKRIVGVTPGRYRGNAAVGGFMKG